MNPQFETETMEQTHSTSPWTEAYQSASAAPEQAMPQDDAQQPTHDALSDIYNRGYSA